MIEENIRIVGDPEVLRLNELKEAVSGGGGCGIPYGISIDLRW
jgi:hypothetical protein